MKVIDRHSKSLLPGGKVAVLSLNHSRSFLRLLVNPRMKHLLNILKLDRKDFNVLRLPIIVVRTPLSYALTFLELKLSTRPGNGWTKPLPRILDKRYIVYLLNINYIIFNNIL